MSLQMRCGTQEQNLPKIHPKPSQNAPKILPKHSLNPPRTLPEPPFKTERENKSIFFHFFQFLEGPGPPKIEPKSRKIEKKLKKSKLKNHMFFNSIFVRIFSILASENEAKIEVFLLLFPKRLFYENLAPVEARARFLRFGASKI